MKTINPDYSVDQIVARMKAAAAASERKDQLHDGGLAEVRREKEKFPYDSTEDLEIQPIELQPRFEPRDVARYHLDELLKFHDQRFVEVAYQAILKRPPDEDGLRAVLENLRSGRMNKIDVLARLRFSSEGQTTGVTIDGLWLPATLRRLYRIPVIGYLLNLTIAIIRLPSMISNHRQFEAHIVAQDQLLVQQLNHVGSTVIKHDRAAAQARAELLTQIEGTHHIVLARVADLTRYVEDRLNDEAVERESSIRRLTEKAADTASQILALEQSKDELLSDAGRMKEIIQHAIEKAEQELRASEQRSNEVDNALKKQAATLRADVEIYLQKISRLLDGFASTRQHELTEEKEPSSRINRATLMDPLYASLAEPFRGKPEEIKERLKIYLPFLSRVGNDPLIDVGSGRGEWLELVSELGFVAIGVDTNAVLIRQCHERGLKVVEDDLISYLASQADDSVGAVTGFHVIEHLPTEQAVEFLTEVMRVLKPGGVVILETPNPRNVLVGTCNFYFDPTHRNPIPNEVLQFLLESRGFLETQLLFLNPSDESPVVGDSELVTRFNQYFYGPMDYGIVAWKPGSEAPG